MTPCFTKSKSKSSFNRKLGKYSFRYCYGNNRKGNEFMAEKRQEPAFTVTDRRLFTEDGELRKNVGEEQERPKPYSPPPTGVEAPPAPTSKGRAPNPGKTGSQPEIPPFAALGGQASASRSYKKSSG